MLRPVLSTAIVLLLVAAASPLQASDIVLTYASFDPLAGEPVVSSDLRAPADSRVAILQLTGPPRQEWIDELSAAGVVFYDYVPNNAYIVRFAGAEPSAPYIRWIGPLHPAYKISPYLAPELLVDFFPDTDLAAVESSVAATGATVLSRDDAGRFKVMIVAATATQVNALAAIEQVRWIQKRPENIVMNDQARWVVQSYVRDRHTLHEKGITGKGQVGAASDSGLDAYDYVDTTGAEQGTDANDASCYFVDDGAGGTTTAQIIPGDTHRKVVGYTVPAGARGDFSDMNGHGTHVVGSIVGDQAPWGAVSFADGQAYDARIFFQDLNPDGSNFIYPPSNYLTMFGEAYDPNGDGVYQPEAEPRTHSNSWGGLEPLYDSGTAQADDFMWTHPDFLILYAAGNSGPGPSTVGNPASGKSLLTVGATTNGGANPEDMASFSSHGPIPIVNRMKPEVGAPGDGIVSAMAKTACGTEALSGTSMATPTVQGVALLMRQYLWDGFYPRGEADAASRIHPSGALLKALLMNSGAPMSGAFTDNGTGGTWPSNGQGWGRVLADDALYFQGDHRALFVQDEYAVDGSKGFETLGETRTFTIDVRNGSPFRTEPLEVTLAWSDYRGSTLTNGSLVNNLDMVVVDPLGNPHYGNDPSTNDFTNKTDLPLTPPDNVNPWEGVYIANPIDGTYTITITTQSLPSRAIDPLRKQAYALVATGDLVGSRGRAEIEYDTYDVNPSAIARLRVADVDRNTSASTADQVTVNVSSSSNPSGLFVTLTETAPDSGIFAGSVTLSTTGAPGELLVGGGNTVRVVYEDADDGSGAPFTAWDTAKVEAPGLTLINPPVLADPGDVDRDGTFTLTWAPAEVTTDLVAYHVEEATDYTETLYDDAEGSQDANWTTDMNPPLNPPWTQSTAYAQSPVLSYWSSGNELVGPVDIDTSLTLNRDVTVPASVSSARLTFFSRYFNDADDTGNVEISTDGGATWAPLLILTNASIPPADTRMQHHEVDLSGYLGAPFRIRFRFNSGPGNYIAAATPGWWVDDVRISGGSWTRVETTSGSETSVELTRTENATYSYRVRGVYAAGTATAWSNVEDIVVSLPAVLDDSDPAIEYTGGWHSKEDASASSGVYHVRVGPEKGNSAHEPVARLVFSGDAITYHYATSEKGGTADVFIDGVAVATVSYAGATKQPAFGASSTYADLGEGEHELRIVYRSGVAYIDGFTIGSSTGGASADASASQYDANTTLTAASLGGVVGAILSLDVATIEPDVQLSVLVEGSSEAVGVRVVDGLGNVIASGGALLDGDAASGVDASLGAAGVYRVEIESSAVTAEPLAIYVTTTTLR